MAKTAFKGTPVTLAGEFVKAGTPAPEFTLVKGDLGNYTLKDGKGKYLTDYFEVRYENPTENKRYFYQLDGEGIRYELVAFSRSIEEKRNKTNIDKKVSIEISKIIEEFESGNDLIKI